MGPYYQTTTQGMGSFFDTFYEHPSLMVLFVVVTLGIGVYIWRKNTDE